MNMNHRNILIALVFWALTSLSQLAFAQTVPMTGMPATANPASAPIATPVASKSGSFFENLEGSMRKFNEKINTDLGATMKHFAVNNVAPKIKQPALVIGSTLALTYLFYEVLQFYAGNRNSMLTVIFDVGIPCCIAAFLIQNYELRVLQFDSMLDVFRMGSIDSGGTNPTNQLMTIYGGILTDIGRALKDLFANVVDVGSILTEPGAWFAGLADFLATVIFLLVILFFILTGISEVMGLLLLGPFLTAVGMAFGPLMIAGLVTPWTTEYFKKWAQFLVISAALTGVINVILSIAGSLLGPSGLGLQGLSGGQPTAAGMIIVIVLLLTVNSLISQAPSITNALLPGSIGANRGAAEGMKQAASKSKDSAKSVASGAGKGVKMAAKSTMVAAKMTKAAVSKIYPKA
jgi:hypothetical protein